ncbi:hypothetical protein AXG89_29625 (plasmid) [Burkholderia sp. PAMC 26561]|nr:hypothetical protein AXG89_23055 [Burkholderia sp. PAMC 26561]AME27983.2 hypothetical protein AXG89_29625 [Burkholderia sp. PAMC 26561]
MRSLVAGVRQSLVGVHAACCYVLSSFRLYRNRTTASIISNIIYCILQAFLIGPGDIMAFIVNDSELQKAVLPELA